MTRVSNEPISQVAITNRGANSVEWLTESLREQLQSSSAKRVMDQMNQFGFTAKLGSLPLGGRLSAAQKKKEVRDLLTVLDRLAPGAASIQKFEKARSLLSMFGGLPADMQHDAGTRNARNRYDFGVMVDEKGAIKGIVADAVLNRRNGLVRGRAVAHTPEFQRRESGGFNVDLGPDVKDVEFSGRRSIRQMIDQKIGDGRFHSDREERLQFFRDQGYDVNSPRSVILITLVDGTTQLGFTKKAGEHNTQPLTEGEITSAKKLGYDLTAYEALSATERKDPDKVREATSSLPRDFGIGFVDECAVGGDLLHGQPILARKPVINIYHPVAGTAVEVEVTLANSAHFSSLYPKPVEKHGEQKIAWRMKSGGLNGELFDPTTEKRYPYLYWEATQNVHWRIDRSQAFCVRGSDAAEFLESACEANGFNAKETADFVTYWLTALEGNEYNVVQFLSAAEYDRFAHMEISPAPDQVTRMFMIFERSNVPVETGTPALVQIQRSSGFVVTEWGGCNLDEVRHVVR